MKKTLAFLFFLHIAMFGFSQDFDNKPGAYLTAVNQTHREMDQKYMAYTSAVAHGKRARKVEKLRLQVLESITNTRYKLSDIPYYNGDKTLIQAHLAYIDFCYKIFNDDYATIVNKEEIAEQSFDEMQAIILMKEQVDQKLKEAGQKINMANKEFAAKYKVNIVEGGKDELGEKLEQAGKVTKYYNKIFLIFFKCNWQDNNLIKAINDKKVNEAEQARNSVIKYANEGLAELDKIQAFQGDASVKQACKQALLAFKSIAEKETLLQTDFILKEENFEKIRKAFEQKSEGDRTKEDVDNYNKAVNEINKAVNTSNQAANNASAKRDDLYKNWEESVSTFFDTNTPKYR